MTNNISERANPCKGREAGCTADCEQGSRCDNCRAAHNLRETARRVERRAKHLCSVCGAKCQRVGGAWLSTCDVHRAYFAARR